MTFIHYIWVGAPKSEHFTMTDYVSIDWKKKLSDKTPIIRQDILGVFAMCFALSKEPKYFPKPKIYYWCLDLYVPIYERLFAFSPYPVKVIGIHGWARSLALSLTEPFAQDLCSRLIVLSQGALDPSSHSSSKIVVKDYLSLLILFFIGGYVFDTNTFPSTAFSSMLLSNPSRHQMIIYDQTASPIGTNLHFYSGHMPSSFGAMGTRKNIYLPFVLLKGLTGGGFDPFDRSAFARIAESPVEFTFENVEVWAMCAPGADALTREACQIYAEFIPVLRTARYRKKTRIDAEHPINISFEEYRNLYTGLMAGALINGVIHAMGGIERIRRNDRRDPRRQADYLIPPEFHFPCLLRLDTPGCVELPCLGLLKFYMNTHHGEGLMPDE